MLGRLSYKGERWIFFAVLLGRNPNADRRPADGDLEHVLEGSITMYKFDKKDSTGDYHGNIDNKMYVGYMTQVFDSLKLRYPGQRFRFHVDGAKYHLSVNKTKHGGSVEAMQKPELLARLLALGAVVETKKTVPVLRKMVAGLRGLCLPAVA